MKKELIGQILIGIYFLAATLIGGFNFYQVVHQATDQNIFVQDPRGVRIIFVEKGGASDRAGLRVGDIITKINGKTFRNVREADVLLQKEYIGKKVEYEILRDGKPLTIQVELAAFGIQLTYLLMVLFGLSMGLLGLYVGIRRPRIFEARLMAATFITINLAMWLSTWPRASQVSTTYFQAVSIVEILLASLIIAMAFHLAFYFPARRFKPTVRIKPRIYMLYAIGLTLAVFIILSITKVLPIELTDYGRLTQLAFIFFVTAGYATINWKHRFITKEFLKKARLLRYINLIFLLILISTILMAIKKDAMWKYTPYFMLALFLIPLFIFLTIQRYRLFQLSIIIKTNWLYYAVSALRIGITAGLFLVMINLLPRFSRFLPVVLFHEGNIEILGMSQLTAKYEFIQQGVLLGYGILFTLIILLFGRWLRDLINRLFFRAKYDYRSALREFSPLGLIAPDADSLAQQVVRNVDHIMHLKQVALAIEEDGSFRIKAQLGFHLSTTHIIPLKDVGDLASHGKTFRELDKLDVPTLRPAREQGGLYLQCIKSKHQLLGFLILGEKRSEAAFNKEDVELLNIISHQIATAIENIRLHQEFSKTERLEHELELAREIQFNSLPDPQPDLDNLELFARLIPAQEVGGDYYDYFRTGAHQIAVLVGDVSGKGMPAALFMSRIQGIVRSLKHLHTNPRQLLAELNTILYRDLPRNSFFTLSYLLLDFQRQTFELARAGHNETILYHSSRRRAEFLEPPGVGLGLDNGTVFRQELKPHKGRFEDGDIFLLYTDGVTETFGRNMEMYGNDKLADILGDSQHLSTGEIVEKIESDLQTFRQGARRHDDVTLVALRVRLTQPQQTVALPDSAAILNGSNVALKSR